MAPDRESAHGSRLSIRAFAFAMLSGVLMGIVLSFPAHFSPEISGFSASVRAVFRRATSAGAGILPVQEVPELPGLLVLLFPPRATQNSAPLWEAVGARAVRIPTRNTCSPSNSKSCFRPFLPRGRRMPSPRALRVSSAGSPIPSCSFSRGSRRSSSSSLVATGGSSRSCFAATGPRTGSPRTDRLNTCNGDMGRARTTARFDICVFRDRRGHEGWFSLGNIVRGRQRQIRGCVLLDAIWPPAHMSFRDILPAIVQLAASKADAVFFQPRPGLDYGECSRWIIPCSLERRKSLLSPERTARALGGFLSGSGPRGRRWRSVTPSKRLLTYGV